MRSFKRLITRLKIVTMMGFVALFVGIGSNTVFAATVSDIQAAVTAFQTIGTLRQGSPINGDAIATAYSGALQNVVKEVDQENGLELDRDTQEAIEDIKNNNNQEGEKHPEKIAASRSLEKNVCESVHFQ